MTRKVLFLLTVLSLVLVGAFAAPLGAQDVDVMDPATFGLNPDRPFDGVELQFLSCCNTAPQFASLAAKTDSEFTEMTGISVTWGDLPFGSYQEQLYLEANNPNTEFDIVFWVDAWGTNIQSNLLPLNDFVDEAGFDFDDYSPAYQGASTMNSADGTIFGLPFRGHPQMMMYRADVFEELGLEVPQTWQDVAAAAEVIAAETDLEPISMYYGINVDQNLFNWYSHLWGAGADIIDENFEPAFNTPEGIAATEQYISYLRNGYTSPSAVAFNEQEANQEIVQGRSAMFVGWWWMASRLTTSENPDVAEGAAFAPAPGWEGGERASYGYLWPVGVLAQSDQQEAALEYMKWLVNPITERRVVLDADEPAFDTNVAVRLSVLADEEVNEVHDGLQGVASEILSEARTIPLIPEYTDMIPILAEAINELAVDENADVQEVLDFAAEDIRAILEDAGYYE
ncbi:MAG: extracellular solute-binding protein [Chloroflexota bacterium]